MKVAFYGGQTAGIIVLLTLIAKKYQVKYVIAEDEGVASLAKNFNLKISNKSSLDDERFLNELAKGIDLLICCHGKKILKKDFIRSIPCINLHPCLYRYKGARPIKRLIEDANPKASVASHWMTEKVDQGEVIVEKFKNIDNIQKRTEAEVYNELYPLYQQVTIQTLEKFPPKK